MKETLLIPKPLLKKWLELLRYYSDDYAICSECENIYNSRYEACKCIEIGFE
jgi:hypothetical protein